MAATAPKARLGEDMLPPPRGEPVNVIVARSKVMAGKLTLTVEAPAQLRAHPGSTLLVKHVYRLQEHSPEREEYRILLRSSLDGKAHAPSLARFGDNYAMPDDYAGFIVHEYQLPATGEAVLKFEVGAEYTVGSWKSQDVDVHEQRHQEGQIRIRLS